MSNKDSKLRLSHQSLRILQAFLQNPRQELCGSDIIKATGLPSGTLYPILLRFEQHGLLISRWEEQEASELGRPRRRLYLITPNGYEVVRKALQELAVPQLSLTPRSV